MSTPPGSPRRGTKTLNPKPLPRQRTLTPPQIIPKPWTPIQPQDNLYPVQDEMQEPGDTAPLCWGSPLLSIMECGSFRCRKLTCLACSVAENRSTSISYGCIKPALFLVRNSGRKVLGTGYLIPHCCYKWALLHCFHATFFFASCLMPGCVVLQFVPTSQHPD